MEQKTTIRKQNLDLKQPFNQKLHNILTVNNLIITNTTSTILLDIDLSLNR